MFIIFFIYADESSHIYSTWDILEIDSAASAWLIKRFIDKDAVFKFYPKGEFITEGIPFDTPDAELRRRHGLSCFESIIKKYNVEDPKLLYIGTLVHEIEINYWYSDISGETEELRDRIREILAQDQEKTLLQMLEEIFMILDEVYKGV